ncbi:MAG: STAS domain-containing protein [Deltaproteobacteria bacterium]|nr:STAS domain-containing protein [Deltaproteobacteria bacterium]
MLRRIFPFVSWFSGYGKDKLRADLLAGVTVALVLIPQSMAYAQLAGLPPYIGLYAAFLPPMVASLFGSSRQLATGPVAVVSMMTAAALEPLATAGSEAFISYAVLLALIVGAFQLLLGVLKLGVVVNFLSHPVVIGFTNAAAIIIATSQLPAFLGVNVEKADHHYETVYRTVVVAAGHLHWPTLVLGVLALAMMAALKKLAPRLPYVLAAVAVATFVSWSIGLEKKQTVALSEIDAPELGPLIDRFNASRDATRHAMDTRAALTPAISATDGAGTQVCASCHTHRTVSPSLVNGDLKQAERGFSTGNVLQLHARAGLLGRYIDELRETTSAAREHIRAIGLESERGTDGSMRFRRAGRPPEGLRRGRGRWYVQVGNKNLDKAKLTLTGGGAVVGNIPSGIPSFSMPKFSLSIIGSLLSTAIIISILGFMEAISIAKAMAARTGQQLDPSQELVGQGLSNIAGAFTQGYAVSGSFSRSAVNIQAGAATGLSSVCTSAVVAVALLFLTPLLYHLPQSVLGAVIMMAVVGLINVKGVVHAWHAQRRDGIISVISFVATLAFAPHLDRGIMVGVVLSLFFFLRKAMRPKIAELSLHPNGSFRDARRFGLAQCRHIAVIRFNGPLFFANTSYLEDEVMGRVRALPELRHIHVMANGISEVDASGEEVLSLMVDRLRAAGYKVSFSGFSEHVLDVLHRTHLYEKIGEENMYPLLAAAVDAIHVRAHEGSDETECPLRKVVYVDQA